MDVHPGPGPPAVADFEAISVEESDFFYEHEGQFNLDGDFEEADHERFDGPEAFLRQDSDKQDDDKSKTKVSQKTGDKKESDQSDNKKKDQSDSENKQTEESKQQAKFDIEVPTNAELAANLKGHLFLVHGESDNNVHPANTLRLVDALITENKRFDMLYLPGTRHGFGRYQPYVTQRMYEFFAEHLLDDYQPGVELSEQN